MLAHTFSPTLVLAALQEGARNKTFDVCYEAGGSGDGSRWAIWGAGRVRCREVCCCLLPAGASCTDKSAACMTVPSLHVASPQPHFSADSTTLTRTTIHHLLVQPLNNTWNGPPTHTQPV